MKTVKISLNSIDKVKAFVNEISKFDCDFDLVSGRYVIDAKSIMGIFSLDLSKPIDLNIHADGAALDTVMGTVPLFLCHQGFKHEEAVKRIPNICKIVVLLCNTTIGWQLLPYSISIYRY